MQNREGQKLGNYRLKKRLDGGGYADVYLAEQIYLGMEVAIKVLKSPNLTKEEREQFIAEAKLVAKLDHPHIVKILEFGIEPGQNTPYLVMDYAQEGTLRRRYPRGTQVPLEKIALYAKQVADALEYAHSALHPHTIVHRDVKPENMLIKRADHLLLSDFGIAVAGFNTGNLSKQLALISANKEMVPIPESIPGTPTYIAPERLLKPNQTQRSSDQYSLAVVVYEWLIGKPPFVGSELEVCSKHINDGPPLLSQPPYNVAPEIEDVVMKALAKKPEFRYATVKEFAHNLDAAIQAVRAKQLYASASSQQMPAIKPLPPAQVAPWSPPVNPQAPVNQSPPWMIPPASLNQPPVQQATPHAPYVPPSPQQQPPVVPAASQLPPWLQPQQPQAPVHQPSQEQAPVRAQVAAPIPQTPPALPAQPGVAKPGHQPAPTPQSPLPTGAQALPVPPVTPGVQAPGTWPGQPWYQGGYIPLDPSSHTMRDAQVQQQQQSFPNAHTTNNIGATAREFGQGMSNFKTWFVETFELDFEFFKLRRFQLFRWLGFVLNFFSAVVVGLAIVHDWWTGFFALLISWGAFFLCISAVKKPTAIFFGFVVACWWFYVGGSLDMLWPPKLMQPPTELAQLVFFLVSFGLHTWYALRKHE